jgi:hypothetical protein
LIKLLSGVSECRIRVLEKFYHRRQKTKFQENNELLMCEIFNDYPHMETIEQLQSLEIDEKCVVKLLVTENILLNENSIYTVWIKLFCKKSGVRERINLNKRTLNDNEKESFLNIENVCSSKE